MFMCCCVLGSVFWLFGGVLRPLVWCRVFVLLWESFVECFVVCVCFGYLGGLRVQMCVSVLLWVGFGMFWCGWCAVSSCVV